MNRLTLASTFILFIVAFNSCNWNEEYCPESTDFDREVNAIYNCHLTLDTNELKEDIIGLWKLAYFVNPHIKVNCDPIQDVTLEFLENNQFIEHRHDTTINSTWGICFDFIGNPMVCANQSFAIGGLNTYTCKTKLMVTFFEIADANIDVFVKE